MIHGPKTLPKPIQMLVTRSLGLCEAMLPHCRAFYPFAAVYENGKVGCLFTEDNTRSGGDNHLIEKLQWRIIDTTTDAESYSVLVYAAKVKTDRKDDMDAIAITTTQPNGDESMLLYPYFRVGSRIVLSPPIHG